MIFKRTRSYVDNEQLKLTGHIFFALYLNVKNKLADKLFAFCWTKLQLLLVLFKVQIFEDSILVLL